MATLRQFHRYVDLPREVQLIIWEFFPHHRHYFRVMVIAVWYDGLYAAANQETNKHVNLLAPAGDHRTQTTVPDEAVAPRHRIRLPSNNNWHSQQPLIVSETFNAIQLPTRLPSTSHIWVNFKLDTFCFYDAESLSASANPNAQPRNFLDYLEGGDTPNWFRRIQNLALLIDHLPAGGQLGPLDNSVLGGVRSLKTVTVVTTMDHFRCNHHVIAQSRVRPVHGHEVERIPLEKFTRFLQATASGSCDCAAPKLSNLNDLFAGRSPRVDVRVEVGMYWTTRPDVEALIAA